MPHSNLMGWGSSICNKENSVKAIEVPEKGLTVEKEFHGKTQFHGKGVQSQLLG